MARTVAVIGASRDRRKFGNKAVRAFLRQGYQVYPVNPHDERVEGLETYASVRDITGPVELATVYVPPEIAVGLLDDIAAKGIKEVWFNPGSESPAVIARAESLGLEPILACSIMGVGESPGRF